MTLLTSSDYQLFWWRWTAVAGLGALLFLVLEYFVIKYAIIAAIVWLDSRGVVR